MLEKDRLIKKVLLEKDPGSIEALARESRKITLKHFGGTVALYAPLYLSNFCDSQCVYCGFNAKNLKLKRHRLTLRQMEEEMSRVAEKGICNILLLTGESPKETPLQYLIDAAGVAKKYFTSIQMEVQPLDEDDYRKLFENGVDGLAVYQETYDRAVYAKVHLAGQKRDFDYRCDAPARAVKAGMRNLSMGVLLGLADFIEDVRALYNHLDILMQKYPGVEYSLSFPRINPLEGKSLKFQTVTDSDLVKIICLTRILYPHVGINLSTREEPTFRDRAVKFGVTRISAASSTKVGGYTRPGSKEGQFDIKDHRSVSEVVRNLKKQDIDPVFTDWRRIEALNETK